MERQQIERFYFDTIGGGKAYLEVNWNKYAVENDMARIVIENKKVVVRREDLETIMFLLTKNTDKYIKDKSRLAAVKYVPMREKEYQRYLENKKIKSRI